jgi:Ca-activated chloride channel family protein
VNAKGNNCKIAIIVMLTGAAPLWAVSAKSLVKQGNQAYANGEYLKAVEQYDQALADTPKAVVPLFNKANSYYHMDDLDEAIELYRDVDLKAKDMSLVEKARYNLGNCAFQQGIKQRDSDLQKAVDLMKNGISQWQRTLKVNPDNPRAGRNIEVARLTIKDIMDQIKQQQNDPNQPQDPNQQQQQQPSDQQNQDQQEQNQSQDPNQPQDQQENQDPNDGDPNDPQPQPPEQNKDEGKDPNTSPEPQPQPDQSQEKEDEVKQDMTAQAILDKEQRQNNERKKRQRSSYQKVDRDW